MEPSHSPLRGPMLVSHYVRTACISRWNAESNLFGACENPIPPIVVGKHSLFLQTHANISSSNPLDEMPAQHRPKLWLPRDVRNSPRRLNLLRSTSERKRISSPGTAHQAAVASARNAMRSLQQLWSVPAQQSPVNKTPPRRTTEKAFQRRK